MHINNKKMVKCCQNMKMYDYFEKKKYLNVYEKLTK